RGGGGRGGGGGGAVPPRRPRAPPPPPAPPAPAGAPAPPADQAPKVDPANWKQLGLLQAHAGGVARAAFHPGGHLLATAGPDGALALWEVSPARQRGVLPGHRERVLALGFSADGKTLLSLSAGGALKRWDVEPLRLAGSLTVVDGGHVLSALFSPDGDTLAVVAMNFGGGEGLPEVLVRLWDTRTGTLR